MAGSSIVAARELAERADRLEKRNFKEKMTNAAKAERAIAGATVLLSAPVLGYLDGRFDEKDGVTGDGSNVFGMPVVPILGVAVAVGGAFVPGFGGTVVMNVGLSAIAGSFYSRARQKGLEAAEKAKEKVAE
jgi:hypothetical protein